MRKDGLTTAKMLAIVRLMSFNRRIKLQHNEDGKAEELNQMTERLKKIVETGISLADFIKRAKEFGFPEIEVVTKRSNVLEFWDEEHEYFIQDKALEDDGTSSKSEKNREIGFVGLRQIKSEDREISAENGKQAAE